VAPKSIGFLVFSRFFASLPIRVTNLHIYSHGIQTPFIQALQRSHKNEFTGQETAGPAGAREREMDVKAEAEMSMKHKK
jgi:hypothetical protein